MASVCTSRSGRRASLPDIRQLFDDLQGADDAGVVDARGEQPVCHAGKDRRASWAARRQYIYLRELP